MMNRACLLTIFLLGSAIALHAQDPMPETDIFTLDVSWDGTAYSFANAVNISNHAGYDNQPAISPDGTYMLYSSEREGHQTDIFKYVFATKATTRMSNTKESEFAPTFVPGGKYYTVVRVDKKKEQRVWQSSLSGGAFTLLTDRLDSIAYHTWWDDHTLVVNMIRKPQIMESVDMKTGREHFLSDIAGRCLQVIPGQTALTFVGKSSDTLWTIRKVTEFFEISIIVPTLRGSEDFVWTPRGTIWAAQGSKLFEYDPSRDTTWREIADFATFGISGCYRPALSAKGDKLAVVSYKGKQP